MQSVYSGTGLQGLFDKKPSQVIRFNTDKVKGLNAWGVPASWSGLGTVSEVLVGPGLMTVVSLVMSYCS